MKSWNLNKSLVAGGIVLIIGLAFLSEQRLPPALTFHHTDKEEFGGYVLHQMLPAFQQGAVESKFISLYETQQYDTLESSSVVILANSITMDGEDWQTLKTHVAQGNTALLGAHSFSALLEDSLNLHVSVYNSDWLNLKDPWALFEKKVEVSFHDLPNFPAAKYSLDGRAGLYQLKANPKDSSNYPYRSLAFNDHGEEVLRSYSIGKGKLLIITTPVLFSNYYLMKEETRPFAAGVLSLFEDAPRAYHYEFYHLGRLESTSPLRYVLSQKGLKAALYIAFVGVLLFLIFGSKRRQRIIPVLHPPANHSLDFVQTLATLHYRTHSHGGIMRKRLSYFQDFVQRQYRIRLSEGESALKELQVKSAADKDLIKKIYTLLMADIPAIGEERLIQLDKDLDEFYKTT